MTDIENDKRFYRLDLSSEKLPELHNIYMEYSKGFDMFTLVIHGYTSILKTSELQTLKKIIDKALESRNVINKPDTEGHSS